MVALALYGAFVARIGGRKIDLMEPIEFTGLILGATLPYAFSAMTTIAVYEAAHKMMNFIIDDHKRQLNKTEESSE